jgi:hypothetical protein
MRELVDVFDPVRDLGRPPERHSPDGQVHPSQASQGHGQEEHPARRPEPEARSQRRRR